MIAVELVYYRLGVGRWRSPNPADKGLTAKEFPGNDGLSWVLTPLMLTSSWQFHADSCEAAGPWDPP